MYLVITLVVKQGNQLFYAFIKQLLFDVQDIRYKVWYRYETM